MVQSEQKGLHRIARHIWGIRDLSQDREGQRFRVSIPDGQTFKTTLDKRIRQVLDALCNGSIHAASPLRLSHYVAVLRHEHGIQIKTHRYSENRKGETIEYEIYAPDCDVTVQTCEVV